MNRVEAISRRVALYQHEMELFRKRRALERKAHRKEWRRQWRLKRKNEPPQNAQAEYLAMLVKDKSEQKRASKIRWRFQTGAGVEEVRNLAEWCEFINTQTGGFISPVELEWTLIEEKRTFKSIDAVIDHLKQLLA